MKKILLLFVLGACLLAPNALNAKPAYRGGIEVTQPDGTTLTIYQHGDEFYHYTTLADGTWVEQQEDGFYKEVPALTTEQVQQQRRITQRQRITEKVQKAYPLNIAPRGLVILVQFSDVKFKTENTREVFDRQLNGENYTEVGCIGSARQYFYEQSSGQYNPQFDVVGPVTLPETMAFYGQNDKAGYDIQSNIDKFVKKACDLADKECNVDYTLYDNNKDNAVDFVFLIYAGYGEADSQIAETIWPHAYWLYRDGYNGGQRFYLDNKRIDMYACGAELNYETKKRDGIGTFCHEFSHVLGLPDLYNSIDDTKLKLWGEWDLMDYGCYNGNGSVPPSYSASARFFLGWLKPTILNSAATVKLGDVKQNVACIITSTGQHNLIGNDPNPTEYFMLENRQQTKWDEHLPGHGLMISKIQYSYAAWFNNTPNSGSGVFVDLIEADGNTAYNAYYGKPSDLFPTGATAYTPYPAYPITNITENDEVITFDFIGGGAEIKLPQNVGVENIETTPENIVAIYNILGQKVNNVTDITALSQGIYIIQTTTHSKKVYIP